jgi:hypothetical protein
VPDTRRVLITDCKLLTTLREGRSSQRWADSCLLAPGFRLLAPKLITDC